MAISSLSAEISKQKRNFLLIPLLFFLLLLNDIIVNFLNYRNDKMYDKLQLSHFKAFQFHFESPLFVPGYYLINHAGDHPLSWPQSLLGIGWVLLIAFLIAFCTAVLIERSVNKLDNKFGSFRWRLWVVIGGWMFVPVPKALCMSYLFAYCCPF